MLVQLSRKQQTICKTAKFDSTDDDALNSGHSVEATLRTRISQIQGIYKQQEKGIKKEAMTEWRQLPNAPLKVDITLRYDANNQQIIMKGNDRTFHFSTN